MPEDLKQRSSSQHTPEEIEAWQEVADNMHKWHPHLQAHVERIISDKGVPVEIGKQALVDAVETVSLSRGSSEALAAANRVPKSSRYPYDSETARADTLVAVAHVSEQATNDAFAAAASVTDEYRRSTLLHKLVPIAVATGRTEELLQAVDQDDPHVYRHNDILSSIVSEVAKTDTTRALSIAHQITNGSSRAHAYQRIAAVSPELAPEMYENIVASLQNGEEPRYFTNCLIKLAEHLPAAGDQALQLLEAEVSRNVESPNSRSISNFREIRDMAELSEFTPDALRSAASTLATELKNDRYGYGSRSDSDLGRARDEVYEAMTHAIERGESALVTQALTVSGLSANHEMREQLFETNLAAGEPQLALASLSHQSVSAFKKVLPLLAQQGDIKTITATVEAYRERFGAEPLIAAACFVPELVAKVPDAIAESRDYQTLRHIQDGILGIDIRTADIASIKTVLALAPDATNNAIELKLATVDPEMQQEKLAKLRQDKDPSARIKGLLYLADGNAEMIDEALVHFTTAVLPELANAKPHDAIASEAEQLLLPLVRALEADGRHIDARDIMRHASKENTKAQCILAMQPYSIQEVTEDLAFLKYTPNLLTTYVENLTTVLSVEQAETLLKSIPEESSAVRVTILTKFAPNFMANGNMEALFSLIPDKADRSYASSLKELEALFIQYPGQAGLADAFGKLENNKECARALLPLLDSNPELAALAFSRVQNFEEEQYTFQDTVELKAQIYTAFIPLLPDGAAVAMEFMETLELENRFDHAATSNHLTACAVMLAKNGNGAEAIRILERFASYTSKRDDLFMKIAPDLLVNGWGNEALTYARNIEDPRQRALCLASIIPPDNNETWGAKRAVADALFGEGALERAVHEPSDRSININVFIGDIVKHPLLIESFIMRASNPAELLRIMSAIDQASEELEDGKSLQMQALRLIARLGSGDVMKEQWSKDLQEQALGGAKADAQLYKQLANIQQLTNNLANLNNATVRSLLTWYSAEDLVSHPWLATSEIATLEADVYPLKAGVSVRQEWLADHAFVRLDGFNRRAVGRLIETRLDNNLEYTLHDASQWLQAFAVHNTKEIYHPETGETERRILRDGEAEQNLLATLFHAELTADELRRLPGFTSAGGDMSDLKTQKFDTLFSSATHTLLYAALLRLRAHGAQTISAEDVRQTVAAWAETGRIEAWIGDGKNITNTSSVDNVMNVIHRITEQPKNDKIPPQINYLREVATNRTDYIDSTMTWLRSYQNLSGQKLASAWEMRNEALRDGIEDKPAAIEEWKHTRGLKSYLTSQADSSGKLYGGVTPTELMDRFPKFINELPVRYGPEKSAHALDKLNRVYNPNADLPAAVIPLDDGYTFKVFAKDDPAGMTLGYDTDCCMTLGGVSESCIYTGYSEPSCGFVGLYDGDNKLVAQSFVWHNQGTLVLDNIEAMRGRKLSNIQGQYRTALERYLKQVHTANPSIGLNAVNIGTGYLEARLSEGLPRATVVEPPVYLRYSDALQSQLELLRLTAEELEATPKDVFAQTPEEARQASQPPVAHPEFLSILNQSSQASEISRLEAQIYPEELHTGHSEILSDLRHANNYSFLIGARTGNSGLVGYALAYKDTVEDAVYVSDLAILPAEQRNGFGVAALEHLLRTVDEAGETRIIFEAREATSYQALQSTKAKSLLDEFGFSVSQTTKLDRHFDNGENAYFVNLKKI